MVSYRSVINEIVLRYFKHRRGHIPSFTGATGKKTKKKWLFELLLLNASLGYQLLCISLMLSCKENKTCMHALLSS